MIVFLIEWIPSVRSRCKEHSSCSLLRKTQQVSWSLGFPLATSSRLVYIKWDRPQTKVRGQTPGARAEDGGCGAREELLRRLGDPAPGPLWGGPGRAGWGKPSAWLRGPRAPHSRRGAEGEALRIPGAAVPFYSHSLTLGAATASLRTARGESWRGWERSRVALSAPPTTPGEAGRPDPLPGPSELPALARAGPLPSPCTSLPSLQVVGRLQQHLDVHPNRRRHSAPGAGATGPTPTGHGLAAAAGHPRPAVDPAEQGWESLSGDHARRKREGTGELGTTDTVTEPTEEQQPPPPRSVYPRLTVPRPQALLLTGPLRLRPSLGAPKNSPPPDLSDWGKALRPRPSESAPLPGWSRLTRPGLHPPFPIGDRILNSASCSFSVFHWFYTNNRAPFCFVSIGQEIQKASHFACLLLVGPSDTAQLRWRHRSPG